MPRENSLSDSVGRSVTPEPDEEEGDLSPASANYSQLPDVNTPQHLDLARVKTGQSKRSLHSRLSKSHPSATAAKPSAWAQLGPKERFRASVRKVMSLHRGTSLLRAGGIGDEPGIDPRRPAVDAAYRHIRQDCEIEIMDYSAVRSTSRRMNNAEFVQFMNLESEDAPPREPWVKVRWINIGGMSWDVIKAVSIKYHLHPLALEDVFHGHARNRSKADYYTKHLFLRVLCHELVEDDQIFFNASGSFTNAPRSTSPEPMSTSEAELDEKLNESDDAIKYGGTPNSGSSITKRKVFGRNPILPTSRSDVKPVYENGRASTDKSLTLIMEKEGAALAQREERKKDEAVIRVLKQGSRVNVSVSPMFFFLFRDGTVLSIRPTPNLSLTSPISYRLKSRDTVLRKSADPSLLLHALLDLIVDKAVQVIDQYHSKIHKFERDILLTPKMSTVRQLHILSGDLILHKRTLDPIKTLIYGLRRYDVDRCAALIDSSDPANKDVKVIGFMSHKAKIYLADVFDHMEYILASLDMFALIAENLINYSFNLASYEMNEVMRRLTIATIIFLPLTFLSGYFGMNFQAGFWSINNNSDLLFVSLVRLLILPLTINC
ncbi:magnesium transporter [Flammula alnicola]|nr:magnesium transporter [Flammula alnicola]